MFASTMANARFGRGTPCASTMKVAMPERQRAGGQHQREQPCRAGSRRSRRSRERALAPDRLGLGRDSSDSASTARRSRPAVLLAAQAIPRTTGISRSRIFLRSVLRFRPSIAAALIWLPRVAARVRLDQRPLHLGQHPVIDVRRRHAVAVRGEELPDMPLDRGRASGSGRRGGGDAAGARRRRSGSASASSARTASAPITSSGHSAASRRIRFSSSRTLPGQR